ncbi:hypothetical protein [Aquitalea sp. LB_tupeE]|uniref:hypothetical protein n=1 Tax=Aquitalea sp. LB_tupeE TaxID=2748078 RepID=UPI0015B80B12|nr:hypothetical protein [Aquitalea sp. LB_tupeE]NWK79801.1 hypothetical protein [Aquitalea sp. LB_tupeE]
MTDTKLHPPPLTLSYLGKPIRLHLHPHTCCLRADDIIALFGSRLRLRLQQLLTTQHCTHHQHSNTDIYWPEANLQRALLQCHRPATQRLRHWLNRHVLPALQQRPSDAPRHDQALAMAAEAGQQISHAVLRAVLEQGQGWQHGHWLLTLRFTPNHASRHAHGRLLALNSQATPLQALAQHIAAPDGLPSSNAELLRLAEACHQLLARRMNKQAWRIEAAEDRTVEPE